MKIQLPIQFAGKSGTSPVLPFEPLDFGFYQRHVHRMDVSHVIGESTDTAERCRTLATAKVSQAYVVDDYVGLEGLKCGTKLVAYFTGLVFEVGRC